MTDVPVTGAEDLLEEPHGRHRLADERRLWRMRSEMQMAFDALRDLHHAVAVFGSARTPVGTPEYQLGVEVGRALGHAGYAVITGGGPGAMQAANEGAVQAGAVSVGLEIDLPFEQGINPYCTIPLKFHYFFARKVAFVRYASAFVALPGGFGTIEEVFEVLTLVQTNKIHSFPVVFAGSDFWRPLMDFVTGPMLDAGKISAEDLSLFHVLDDPEQIVAVVDAARS